VNTKLFSSALVLSLAAGSALAAGADGPSFPSFQAAQSGTLTRAQVHAEAVQLRAAAGQLNASADGSVVSVQAAPAAQRAREAVKAEVAQPIRISSTGNATTPY